MKTSTLFKKLDREKDIISIEKFIINYLYSGEQIYLERMSHSDLKKYNSTKVISLSYDFALANFDLVKRGTILMVKDGYNKIVPYLNPMELEKILKLDSIEEEITRLKKERIYQLSQILSHWIALENLFYQKEKIEGTINLLMELNKNEYLEQMLKEGENEHEKHKRRSKIKQNQS